MEEREPKGFQWAVLFVVTSFCTLAFSTILKLVDGYFSPVLLLASVGSLLMAFFSYCYRMLLRHNNRKKQESKVFSDSY
jgi:hypothetical protein